LIELEVDNKDPIVIFDQLSDGRLSSFNIAPVIKKIREAQ
jgi:hypothetical protein